MTWLVLDYLAHFYFVFLAYCLVQSQFILDAINIRKL